MNSLDQAISLQLDSINILERHNPDAKAVEKARDAAKSAAKILDAAVVMMSFGIYSVAEPPVDKFTDPNDYTISFPEVPPSEALPAVAAEIVAALPPMPDLLAGFPEDSEEQLHAFTHAKNNLIGAGQKSGLGPMDWSPDDWDEAWDADRLECIRRLVYATEFRTPTSWAYPSDEEFTAWCAGFAPVLPAMPEALSAFDAWDETEQTDVFTERLHAYQTLWQAYHDHAGEISWQIPEPPTVDPLGDMEGGEL